MPESGTSLESALVVCASHVFLQTPHTQACTGALRRALGETRWQYLTVFLAFVRTAHYWTKVHTELRLEDDVLGLLAGDRALEECLLNDPEAHRSSVSPEIARELEALRGRDVESEAERRRSRAILRESEERFRAAFESSVVGFAILSLETEFVQVNDGFCAMTGFSRAELLTMRYASLTHPEDVARTGRMLAQLAAGQQSAFVLENRYRRKDGVSVWVQNGVSLTRNADGHPRGLVLVCHDVTENRRANQMKDDFLATLSHELRTPLNAMLGWTQILRTSARQPDLTDRALDVIERNARAQAALVDDLLDLSRIITGKLDIADDVVALTPVITSAIEAVRPAAASKNLSLVVRLDPNIDPHVRGDAPRLHQIVSNLLTNAVKFTPEGGTIEVALACEGSDVLTMVRDTGRGIDAELLPFVFDRLRQGDSRTNRRHGGLGLGLAIVRHLTEAHGGRVSVESAGEGHGATFTVRLPVSDARPADTSPAATAQRLPASLRGARVLIVDDVADARELMRMILEAAGAQVTVASSSVEVMNIVRRERFDVLLADIGMPEFDGYALVQAIERELPAIGSSMRTIAVTAFAGKADRARALAAGFDRHFAKPVDPRTLVEVVAGLLTTSEPSDR